ncbi:MAG: hypothetical protein ACKVJG_07060 [Candidatus Latescibacterota bacterium]|jgi:hypothetical protein
MLRQALFIAVKDLRYLRRWAAGGPARLRPIGCNFCKKYCPRGGMDAMHRLISFGPAAYEKVHFELNAKRMRIEIEAK